MFRPITFTVGGTTYSCVRKLDERGSGELVLAQSHAQPGRAGLVVIKRMRAAEYPLERLRLVEEARLVRNMDHHALTRVLAVDTREHRPLVVMEYVEGLSLERVLNRAARRHQPVSAPFAASVAAQVADALHYIHHLTDPHGQALQLVHRDVSPRNIHLSSEGEVKLSDFGAAFTPRPGHPATPALCLKGDVAYSAPEVLRGEKPDARADLFSLGLVLFEMLTSKHLLDLPHAPAAPPLTRLFKRLVGKLRAEEQGWADPAELAARAACIRPEDVERETAGVEPALRAVLHRALRVNPAERYAHASLMRMELRAYLASLPQPFDAWNLREELRELIVTSGRHHGEAQTSRAPIPAALGGRRLQRHS
ncbi:serine/threonine-protein kinase [Hyalangium rubrum]|uniref:non-specific serine/threonine protein kinase n=1 Tax=Hyalangium rubrum TaxID=3103134 RepID=A0ABU5H1U3_9BACT|nr:serine/threonine-protein kinase [Hyalangium sp. s54d21]MDY7226752.1 serine/threonine-protein kinase [Hyalangium sp. s54d21]